MRNQQEVGPGRELAQNLGKVGQDYTALLFECQKVSEREFVQAVKSFREIADLYQIGSLRFAVDRLEYVRNEGISSVNIGGTMGSGKSTLGKLLAEKLAFSYKDSDHFHPEENKEKMNRGIPLNDNDRVTFLDNVRSYLLQEARVSSCSALTELYRAVLCGQGAGILRDPNTSKAPLVFWNIADPNFGLQHIILSKPYEQALSELDEATQNGKRREIDGAQHFIEVNRHTEYVASINQKTPLLLNQYQLLYGKPIFPWEAILIDSTTMKTASGYDCTEIIGKLSELPIRERRFEEELLFERKDLKQ